MQIDDDSTTSNETRRPAKIILRNIKTIIAMSAGIAMIAVGVVQLSERAVTTSGVANLPDTTQVVTEDTPEPDESKPDNTQYQVPGDQPKLIHIPKIGVAGPIQRVGLNKENAISVPTNVNFAGWFTSSVKPGDAGLSIIDGHVSGRYTDGIFKQLTQVTPGDLISIEFGDGSTKSFEVVAQKTLPEVESAQYLFEHDESYTSQLNLITCGGTFNRETQQYADRTIVVARLQI